MNWEVIKQNLIEFLQTEVKKAGKSGAVVGLSGGLDSAVVAILCKEAFGENVHCVMLPSHYSSDSSVIDAQELCHRFDISYEVVSVAPLIQVYEPLMDGDKLRIGNFSARVRMAILYDISAKHKALVVGTSNRSEILLGYGTIFGDTACAINPVGNIYKSDEFEFAKFLGVPDSILAKRPSADLWEGQADEDELGFTYKELDIVLKELFDKNRTKEELIKDGFSNEILEFVLNRYHSNAFKRAMPVVAQLNL
ncbi:NAD+ synthase [Arcobacter sp. FWKO B]|uniref:NAD+ synthase n=1 Tax=Arcobacter sp. FWKO B TaxID=2593672 RepID=UPI00190468D5|nr:NAD+ synthase [Arcobacter sp. FWKO B]